MDFAEWVRANETLDREQMIATVLAEFPQVVRDAVARAIDHVLRGDTREEERALATTLLLAAPATLATSDGTARFASLLRQRFALGDGTRVTWGQATAEQHEARAELLRKMIAGLSETKANHEAAAQRLRAAGRRCLDELFAVAAA